MSDVRRDYLRRVGYDFACENPELNELQLARKAEDLADAYFDAEYDEEIEKMALVIFEGMLAARKME